MAELSISGPRLVARQSEAPSFIVSDEGGRLCAIEVAGEAEKLDSHSNSPAPRWASWEQGELVQPGSVIMPPVAWEILKASERLFYRAHSSMSATAWVNHRVTTTDAILNEAPSIRVCDAWILPTNPSMQRSLGDLLEIAAEHPDSLKIEGGRSMSALVCLHRFSARSPVEPSQLEWAVVLAAESNPPGNIHVLVQRFQYMPLELIASQYYQEHGTLALVTALTALPPIAVLAATGVASWRRKELGPFIVLQNNCPPPPDEEGGTCVVLGESGRCVYLARTKWSGLRVIDIPAPVSIPPAG